MAGVGVASAVGRASAGPAEVAPAPSFRPVRGEEIDLTGPLTLVAEDAGAEPVGDVAAAPAPGTGADTQGEAPATADAPATAITFTPVREDDPNDGAAMPVMRGGADSAPDAGAIRPMVLAPPSADDPADTPQVITADASPNDSPKVQAAAAAATADPALSVTVGTINTTERTRYVSGTIALFQDSDPHGPASQGYSATIDWGDGSATQTQFIPTALGGVGQVPGSHAYVEEGTYTIRVTVTDLGSPAVGSSSMGGDSGGATATGTGTANVADAPLHVVARPIKGRPGAVLNVPVADFTDGAGPELTDEFGTPYGDYAPTINWGDGTTSGGTASLGSDGVTFTVTGSHIYASAGTYPVGVTVSDGGMGPGGGSGSGTVGSGPAPGSGSASGTATVTNPTITAAGVGALHATEGAPFGGTVANFTASPNDQASDYAATIDWGDGSATDSGTIAQVGPATGGSGSSSTSGGTPSSASFAVSGAHTYPEEGGPWTVNVTVSEGPNTATVSDTMTVADAPLSATGAPAAFLPEGNATGVLPLATFTDADPGGVAADFSATINWADGTTSSGTITPQDDGSFAVTGSHTYTGGGTPPYAVQVTIRDSGGASAVVTDSITPNYADLDGKDASPGATWAVETLDQDENDSPGILVDFGGTSNPAQVWAHATGITGATRTLTWNPAQLTVSYGSTTYTTGSLTLSESDGDRVYNVIGGASFPADDRPIAAYSTPPADAPTIMLAAQGPGGAGLGQDDVKFTGAQAKLALVSVAYAGAGQISMNKDMPCGANKSYTHAMTFASTGDTPITNPIWISDGENPPTLNDPVAYVMGSTPQVTATLKVVAGILPANASVSLAGTLPSTPVPTTITTQPVTRTTSTGVTGQPLVFTGNFGRSLANQVQNVKLTITWKASINGAGSNVVGTSTTRAFVTLGTPKGDGISPNGNVSARRLDYLTADAAGAPTAFDVVAKLGPDLTSHDRFYWKVNYASNGLEPFTVMDGPKADCMTLVTLMKRSLDLVGVPPEQSVVKYVYASSKSWVGLSSTQNSDYNMETKDFINYNLTVTSAKLGFYSGGWNNYEGCLVWTGINPNTQASTAQWWMGGSGSYLYNDYDVLMRLTKPNDWYAGLANGKYQAYVEEDQKGDTGTFYQRAVPYPTLPDVRNKTVAQAQADIAASGFQAPTIVYAGTSDRSYDGLANRCYSTGSHDPVSPYDPITLLIWKYSP